MDTNRVPTSETDRVSTGPYRVANIFLKELKYCVSQDAQSSVFCLSRNTLQQVETFK